MRKVHDPASVASEEKLWEADANVKHFLRIGIEKHKQNMCICTSLFVSFSVALDKNQTFTNNNVFHKLSRPTLPLQVVYKPWLIRISQGNKKLQHSSLCRIWFVHIWTSYITGRQDSHWTLCVSFGHTFDTIKYDFSILCQCLMRSHARKYLPINYLEKYFSLLMQ